MSIKLRFTLLLSLLLGGFLLAFLGLRLLERREQAAMVATDRQARAQLLNHWLDATSRELPQFTADLAQSAEFAGLLTRVPAEADAVREKLAASLTNANASSLWVVRPDGTIVLGASANAGAAPTELPLARDEFAALVAETPSPRFFAESGGELREFSIRRLQVEPAREWIVVARRWNDARLQALADLTEGDISLRGPHELAHPPATNGELVLLRPLADWQGRPVRVLRLEYEVPDLERSLRTARRQTGVFIVFGLLVLAAMALALQSWVLRPLRRIRESLAADDSSAVAPLSGEKTEFGRVAQLVLSSFVQRQTLEREVAERTRAQEALARSELALRENLEERARLGRDLHDGIIQSLYAAGMGLAGIRNQLRPDQAEAAARLEQTRGTLNETIHDVRNFIIGLEPEALKLQTFSQAVAALLEAMRAMRSFRSDLHIDEHVAARLTLAQRVHALQIAREAISNALRHGEADYIRVALRRQEDFAEFEVSDDGSGFDATSAGPHGKGLANFAQRARELGAELTVDSSPGRGTQVKLVFALLP